QPITKRAHQLEELPPDRAVNQGHVGAQLAEQSIRLVGLVAEDRQLALLIEEEAFLLANLAAQSRELLITGLRRFGAASRNVLPPVSHSATLAPEGTAVAGSVVIATSSRSCLPTPRPSDAA